MISGGNGILRKTVEAKENTEKSKEVENIELAFMSAKIKSSYTNSEEILENELNDKQYEVIFDGDYYKIISKETKNEYIFDKYGNEKNDNRYYYISDNVISDGNLKINVGDSINYKAIGAPNYKYVSNEERNGYANQSFTFQDDIQWVVLGINNGGELLITSTKSLNTTDGKQFFFKGEKGFEYGIAELDNICKLYENGIGSKGARSIRIEDINKITKYNPMSTGNGQKYGKGNLNEYGNEVRFYWNGDLFPYYEAENGVKGVLEQKHNNFFTYNEEKNNFINNELEIEKMKYIDKIKTNFYSYYIDTLTDNKEDSESSIKKFNKAYELISKAGAYWMASKTIETNQTGVYYGFRIYASWTKRIAAGGFYSSYGNNNDGQGCSVRPVIIINDKVKLSGDSKNGWILEK